MHIACQLQTRTRHSKKPVPGRSATAFSKLTRIACHHLKGRLQKPSEAYTTMSGAHMSTVAASIISHLSEGRHERLGTFWSGGTASARPSTGKARPSRPTRLAGPRHSTGRCSRRERQGTGCRVGGGKGAGCRHLRMQLLRQLQVHAQRLALETGL